MKFSPATNFPALQSQFTVLLPLLLLFSCLQGCDRTPRSREYHSGLPSYEEVQRRELHPDWQMIVDLLDEIDIPTNEDSIAALPETRWSLIADSVARELVPEILATDMERFYVDQYLNLIITQSQGEFRQQVLNELVDYYFENTDQWSGGTENRLLRYCLETRRYTELFKFFDHRRYMNLRASVAHSALTPHNANQILNTYRELSVPLDDNFYRSIADQTVHMSLSNGDTTGAIAFLTDLQPDSFRTQMIERELRSHFGYNQSRLYNQLSNASNMHVTIEDLNYRHVLRQYFSDQDSLTAQQYFEDQFSAFTQQDSIRDRRSLTLSYFQYLVRIGRFKKAIDFWHEDPFHSILADSTWWDSKTYVTHFVRDIRNHSDIAYADSLETLIIAQLRYAPDGEYYSSILTRTYNDLTNDSISYDSTAQLLENFDNYQFQFPQQFQPLADSWPDLYCLLGLILLEKTEDSIPPDIRIWFEAKQELDPDWRYRSEEDSTTLVIEYLRILYDVCSKADESFIDDQKETLSAIADHLDTIAGQITHPVYHFYITTLSQYLRVRTGALLTVEPLAREIYSQETDSLLITTPEQWRMAVWDHSKIEANLYLFNNLIGHEILEILHASMIITDEIPLLERLLSRYDDHFEYRPGRLDEHEYWARVQIVSSLSRQLIDADYQERLRDPWLKNHVRWLRLYHALRNHNSEQMEICLHEERIDPDYFVQVGGSINQGFTPEPEYDPEFYYTWMKDMERLLARSPDPRHRILFLVSAVNCFYRSRGEVQTE